MSVPSLSELLMRCPPRLPDLVDNIKIIQAKWVEVSWREKEKERARGRERKSERKRDVRANEDSL